MRTVGDDIVLLAIRQDGGLSCAAKMRFALSGSELVRLAAERRIDIVDKRIHVLDATPTGDPLVDSAFANIQRSNRPPKASEWVARPRAHLATKYLDQLAERGVIRVDRSKRLGLLTVVRWTVLDILRVADARARLDAVARSTGPVDAAGSALGGLVQAIGLDAVLDPAKDNPGNKAARDRLRQIAGRDRTASAVHTATQQAAVDASIDAAVQASLHAAVQASVHAAHHAAHDGGASTGHH